MVFAEIETKAAYLEYIVGKLDTIRRSDSPTWPAMGRLDHSFAGISLVFAKVEDGKVQRLDMCGIPSSRSARRSGKYPGLVQA